MLLRSIAVWGELHALNTWMPPKGLSTRQKWKLRHLQTLCRGPWPTTGPLGHACVSQQPWRSNLRAALLTFLHGLFPVSFERLQLPNKWNQCSCQPTRPTHLHSATHIIHICSRCSLAEDHEVFTPSSPPAEHLHPQEDVRVPRE